MYYNSHVIVMQLTGERLPRVLLADNAGVDGLVRRARRKGEVVFPVHILKTISRRTTTKRLFDSHAPSQNKQELLN